MNNIDHVIRESLLESYLYHESVGDALLTEDSLIWKQCLRRLACTASHFDDARIPKPFRCYNTCSFWMLRHKDPLDLISTQDYFHMVLMNELQKNRTE